MTHTEIIEKWEFAKADGAELHQEQGIWVLRGRSAELKQWISAQGLTLSYFISVIANRLQLPFRGIEE